MQHFKILVHRDWISHAHAFLSGRAGAATDIDIKIVNFWGFRFAIHLLHVRRRIANHAQHGSLGIVHRHTLGFAHDGVHAAHPFHPNESIVINVIHRKRNLIRVAGEHNARAASGVERGHAVTVFVMGHFIGKLIHVIQPHPLPPRFVAGGAGRIDEFF